MHKTAILTPMKLALKITPQRSTQYSTMVQTLAAPELLASPLGQSIESITPVTLAGQAYLLTEVDAGGVVQQQAVLSRFGAISETYEYFERVGEVAGPLLRPIEPQFVPFVPVEMAEARRYKGKTNEIFTRVLLNIAIFAGGYSQKVMQRLRILDPLAGGGTTLFLALSAGYDAFGIEQNRHDVETTEVFVRQYLHSEHIPYKEVDERRKLGRRYQFTIGHKAETRSLVLAHGDTTQANLHMQEVPGGPHMHAIVGDLPYGIQHFGEIAGLLHKALPVWENMLLPGGTLALAWNATRIERVQMTNLLKEHTSLTVRNDPPYTHLAHTVDRVIKQRDIIVAVRE